MTAIANAGGPWRDVGHTMRVRAFGLNRRAPVTGSFRLMRFMRASR
jgi:hypothetical protein